MPASLYNEEFVINDLLRAAHPGGGTNVVSIDTPSGGGGGRVKDLLEKQIVTIERFVHKQPVVEKLASLADNLDEAGLTQLSFDVVELIKNAAEPDRNSAEWQRGMEIATTLFRELERGAGSKASEELKAKLDHLHDYVRGVYGSKSKKKGQKTYFKFPKRVYRDLLTKIIRGTSEGKYPEGVKALAIRFAKEVFPGDPQLNGIINDQRGISPSVDGAINIAETVQKSNVNPVALNKHYDAALERFLETAAKFNQAFEDRYPADYADNFEPIQRAWESNAVPILKNRTSVEDPSSFSSFNRLSYGYKQAIENAIERKPALKDLGNAVLKGLNGFSNLQRTYNPTMSMVEVNRISQSSGGETIQVPRAEEGQPQAPANAPGGSEDKEAIPQGRVPGSPSVSFDQGAPPPRENPAVAALQKLLGMKQKTGIYDQKTHNALYYRLDTLAQGEGKDAEIAQVLLRDYFISNDVNSTANRAEQIYYALTGRLDPTGQTEVKAPDRGVVHMDFISPLGTHVKNFPIGAALQRSADNPFYFIRALQGYNALPKDIDPEQLLQSRLYDATVDTIRDRLTEMGDDPKNVAFVEQVMRELKGKGADALGKAYERQTTMSWIKKIFPHEAEKIRTSSEAMKELIAFLSDKGISDEKGFINLRRARANKYYIMNALSKVIKMHGLERAKGPAQPDPASADARGENTGFEAGVERAMKIIENMANNLMVSNNPKGTLEMTLDKAYMTAKQNGYMGTKETFRDQIVIRYKQRLQAVKQRQKLPNQQTEPVDTTPQDKEAPAESKVPESSYQPGQYSGLAGQQKINEEFGL